MTSGGTIVAVNGTTEFMGNLNISGSSGTPNLGANGFIPGWGKVTIDGNLNYIGNFVPLIVAPDAGGAVEVKGTFNYSGNTYSWDASQPLQVDGNSSIS